MSGPVYPYRDRRNDHLLWPDFDAACDEGMTMRKMIAFAESYIGRAYVEYEAPLPRAAYPYVAVGFDEMGYFTKRAGETKEYTQHIEMTKDGPRIKR